MRMIVSPPLVSTVLLVASPTQNTRRTGVTNLDCQPMRNSRPSTMSTP